MKLRTLSENNPISIYFKIAFLANHYRDPTNKLVEQKYNLTRPEFAILFCLYQRDKISAVDIVDLTQLPQNSLSRGATSLISKKLITKMPDLIDGRKNVLSITNSGNRIAKNFLSHLIEANQRLTSALTNREAKQFESLLDKICDATSKP